MLWKEIKQEKGTVKASSDFLKIYFFIEGRGKNRNIDET